MQVLIEGLEDHIERVVTEKVAAALSGHADAGSWFTSDEAAEYLGLSRATVHDLVCDGRLPRHGAKGHRLRFRRTDLDAYARRG